MSARESTTKRTQRESLSARAIAIGHSSIGLLAALLLAALLALTLALAPRAEAYVYWTGFDPTEGPAIGRANLDGTGVDQSFITGLGFDLAVDGAHVYWTDRPRHRIGRANLDGTGVDQSFITQDSDTDVGGVAVDAAGIYWAGHFSESVCQTEECPDYGFISRLNLDGISAGAQLRLGAGDDPCGVAVGASHVYWADPGPGGRIGRANLDFTGVDKEFITDVPVARCGVAVDAAHIYWSSRNGMIARADLDGTGVDQSFVPAAGEALRVAVDDAHVYWTDAAHPGIGRAKLDGTGVDQTFIPGVDAGGIAVDALSSPPPSTPPPSSPPPSMPPPQNDFGFGKVKKNTKRGTAKLTVKVPGPGELQLAKNKRVKPKTKRAGAAGKEKLPIKPRRKAKKRLAARGKAKVKAKVTYTPDGGEPNTQSKKIKLVKRR
jgi:virginiamycin B lyase